MNEHDSERIAGLLEADGLEAGDDVETADVIVLNTCCIRENADNRLYGTLGHLKSLKDRRPDLEIVVAGKPCDSSLLHKLGPAPPYGARMPYNGPPYYSLDDLGLLRDWIAEGAHDN